MDMYRSCWLNEQLLLTILGKIDEVLNIYTRKENSRSTHKIKHVTHNTLAHNGNENASVR